jgi:hypothetical protein
MKLRLANMVLNMPGNVGHPPENVKNPEVEDMATMSPGAEPFAA